VSQLSLNDFSNFLDVELIDLSGGASGGVAFSISNADQIDNTLNSAGVTIRGGSGPDSIIVRENGNEFRYKTIFDSIESVTLSDNGSFQRLAFSPDTSFINSSSVTIQSTRNSDGTFDAVSIVANELNPDSTFAFDFSNMKLINLEASALHDTGQGTTISFNEGTNFGNAPIRGSFGTGNNDVLNYLSDLKAGNGDTIAVADDLSITRLSANGNEANHLINDSNGVIDFEFSRLGVSFDGSASESQLLTAVQSLLESTDGSSNLTGSSERLTQGATGTEQLLMFRSGENTPTHNILIVRYEENDNDISFANELSLMGIVRVGEPTSLTRIDDANIT